MSNLAAPLRELQGEWDIVTDCETAGPLSDALKEAGLDDHLSVRSHPWVPTGTVFALRPGEEIPSGGGFIDAPVWVTRMPGERTTSASADR
ncbi:MAG: hypothetical protein J2P30_00450 [Actinobacteria bacterium]|nr:hypothetical protein [Actinomycetota bacterium]